MRTATVTGDGSSAIAGPGDFITAIATGDNVLCPQPAGNCSYAEPA